MISRNSFGSFASFCLAVFVMANTQGLSGQSSPPVLSLDDAVSMAKSANPQMTMTQANQRGAASEIGSARSALLPKIGVSEAFTDSTDPVFAFGARLRQGRFAATDFAPNRLNYPAPTSDFMSTAGATWMLFDSGSTLHQMRSARTSLKAAEEQTEATGQSIAFSVVRGYYRALLSDQDKVATAAAVDRAQAFAKQAHDRVDTGMALAADAMQADVEVSLRKQDAAEAESNAVLAYADLAGVLGDPSKTFALAAPPGTPGEISDSLEQLQSMALQARPDLMAAKNRVAAAGQSVSASRAAYGPQISTFANVQADNPHALGGGSNNWTVGAKIEMQLFDGGARRAQVSKAAASMDASAAMYRQAEIQAALQVKQAYYARQTAERQYGISDEMLRKTQATLKTAEDRYSAGLVTVTEVLREQEQLRDMEINRAQSLYQWWTADAQLRLATGNMNGNAAGVYP